MLNIKGALLEKNQLEKYLEQQAAEHNIKLKSDLVTYPIPKLEEDFKLITKVYNLLNEHVKAKINIHPAGEWLLDNYYIINENIQMISEEMNKKAYTKLPGLENGKHQGFARAYILAYEIVGHRNNRIEKDVVEDSLKAYQNKKMLNMEELWCLPTFLKIALIKNISEISEKIYFAQLEKEKVLKIIKDSIDTEIKGINIAKHSYKKTYEMKCAFVEYMSYKLKKYGKSALPYLQILEEQVNITGSTIEEMINKQHYSIAISKVAMGNAINSLKNISRMDFESIFEDINGVEAILKFDPANIYNDMSFETKALYRDKIKKISRETGVSEIYIVKKAMELAQNYNGKIEKKSHVGYYLIDFGSEQLFKKIGLRNRRLTENQKYRMYIANYFTITTILAALLFAFLAYYINDYIALLLVIIAYIPITEIYSQILNYILLKRVSPNIIPKMDLSKGITEKDATFVVIPTIIDTVEKLKEQLYNLEVYYLANKSENIYFSLLGDCSSSKSKESSIDENIIAVAKEEIERINKKYQNDKFPRFHFLYRRRKWCPTEKIYLGWERKRGLLTQFNELLINKSGDFLFSSIDLRKLPEIKYIITLDSDTKLTIDSAFELIGAMAHPLNKPYVKNGRVIEGYGIIQPRVGIDIEISQKSLFTEIYAGAGGTDNYTNAISDLYQDNFRDAIYTGKGIYNLKVFHQLLNERFPENIILSHDLLESNYLKCGLATDILLMDGFPTKYNSFMQRLHRWIRGDWQIIYWLKSLVEKQDRKSEKNPISELAKFKIIDNLRRSILPITTIILLAVAANNPVVSVIAIISSIMPTVLDIFNNVIFKKEITPKQTYFTRNISGILASILRGILEISFLPYKAYISIDAIIKTLYRLKTKEHLLEWITAEESEKNSKNDLTTYYNNMWVNILFGVIIILYNNLFTDVLGFLWLMGPGIAWYISQINKEKIQEITSDEREYLKDIARKTWDYFNVYMNVQNNYLPPDNVQEGKIANRTSSTNIGLGILAIINAYDMNFITLDEAMSKIKKTFDTIEKLDKWNGHLYNWYNTVTLEPLMPRYISTVDSGNFVGYLYVLKQFLIEKNQSEDFVRKVDELIQNTNFRLLYDKETRLFSIGFNIEENKLTESYYDFLASEARQASLIAIAKKDVPAKHWNSLSRTLTSKNYKKGLISWSGTAFEYLMPNINIKKYKGSLLDESCKFAIMNQKEYVEKLDIPWGISEAAFSLRDLNGNYQYKAFGIPNLGMKRGLGEELVIAPYASAMAIKDYPKDVVKNLKEIEKINALGEYGFYESIDYTPKRLKLNQSYEVVKTYMAHHQALTLSSINNFFNNDILVERFNNNPEIRSIDMLLQERMPTNIVIKNNGKKIEKLRYTDYESYNERIFTKREDGLEKTNLIANPTYTIFTTDKGEGFSKYKDTLINRYKVTADEKQGVQIYIKNIKNKKVWNLLEKVEEITFAEDRTQVKGINGNIETKVKITVAPKSPVEIREIVIKNTGFEEELIEVTTYFEPILSTAKKDYAHPAFNNLFLNFEKQDDNIIVNRTDKSNNLIMATTFYTENECIGELEFELDKPKFLGRNNMGIPQFINDSRPFSNRMELCVEPIIAFKRTLRIKPEEKVTLNLIISVGENREVVLKTINRYKNQEKIINIFSLSKARVEAETRYLEIKSKNIEAYQKLIMYLIYRNPIKYQCSNRLSNKHYKQEELWQYGISGDKPIIFVRIKSVNDIETLEEILKFYEYCRIKNVDIDLVIQNQEENSYEKYVRDEIQSAILNMQIRWYLNNGIYVFENINKSQEELFEFLAKVTINTWQGNIRTILMEMEEEYLKNIKKVDIEKSQNQSEEKGTENITINIEEYKYYNEYGGFSADGKEYHIIINNKLPNVWSHVLANENFGTVLTDNMGGYIWYENSRLNRGTSWNNNPATDIPSEIIYLKNMANGKLWTLNHGVIPDESNHYVIYGFGYAKYKHISEGIIQEATIFVPKDDNVKINMISLKNTEPKSKKIKLVYYIKPVLGEDESITNSYIKTELKDNAIYSMNLYGKEQILYVTSNEKIVSFSGNKNKFIGNGNLTNPDGLKRINLDNETGIFNDSCIAVEFEVEIGSFGRRELVIATGMEKDEYEASKNIEKYITIRNCEIELENVRKFWEDRLGQIQVKTPIESLNIMLNGWIIYQTLACRMWARTSYYQSGGAFGFRDQLQDALCLKYTFQEALKNQIIKACKHQFIEGDVEHWWHEGTDMGIRTKFSDDLFWLCYAVFEYLDFTGDMAILDEEVEYRSGEALGDNEDEKYMKYTMSSIKESVYEHCIKTIEKGINIGRNGLMKIGSGDWNDGFSTVGNKGIGESVWLSFFVFDILNKFIPICKLRGDLELATKYENIKMNLKKNINQNAWDGRWFRRAYTDEGEILGTISNEECKIDSIVQSWSVISNAGDNDKKYIAMENLENYLIDKENGVIKLLTPAFKDGKLEPGYIKAYPKGVRENGGQYTHAGLWVVIAQALLGFGDKAMESYKFLTPIEHARTKEAVNKYKVEPYVISADVYGEENLVGRGGWSWYTGSSSWYYKAGIEYILGLKIADGILKMEPCIPKEWKEYSIRYKYKNSIYNIFVKNPNGKNTGVEKFVLNGLEISEKSTKLIDNERVNEIIIEM